MRTVRFRRQNRPTLHHQQYPTRRFQTQMKRLFLSPGQACNLPSAWHDELVANHLTPKPRELPKTESRLAPGNLLNTHKYLALIPLVFAFLSPHNYSIQPSSAQTAQNPASEATGGADGGVWDGYSLLNNICSCESWGDPNKKPREFLPDGNVLHGQTNPNDIGACQINIPSWGADASVLGFDIFTYQGNIEMAKWIFDHEGAAPWKYSKGCWGKYA
jgi:hypothetical protein